MVLLEEGRSHPLSSEAGEKWEITDTTFGLVLDGENEDLTRKTFRTHCATDRVVGGRTVARKLFAALRVAGVTGRRGE